MYMNDKSKLTEQVSSDNATSHGPRSYNFLLRMSKRMGRVATTSFVEVKEFLNKEISVSQTERFIAGMPRLRLQKHEKASSSSASREEGHPLESTSAREEGRYEARKEKKKAAKEGETEIDPSQNLRKIIAQSHEVLASANTVFPVTLFPDTVFVDRTKVTIIRRDFFWSSDTMSIRIEDVLNVSATLGPLFGSLTIVSRVMSTVDHFQINHFWRSDAIHLKHIIQGYVIAQHNKIDVAHLPKDELKKTLVEIGHDSNQ